jgi:hypothetical protein
MMWQFGDSSFDPFLTVHGMVRRGVPQWLRQHLMKRRRDAAEHPVVVPSEN